VPARGLLGDQIREYADVDAAGQVGAEAATLDAVDTPTWEYMKRAFAVGFGR
jgi:hypothetical protein